MIEKGKISAYQMGFMMYPTIVATAILIVPGITAKYAHNDLWISPIVASLVGFITVVVVHQLNNLYPRQTVIQYCQLILGRFLGKALGLIYILFYLHTGGIVIREYSDFISLSFLPHTPMIIISSTLILTAAYTVRNGIESVARSAFICTIIFIFPATFMLFLIPDLDLRNMLPVMEHGIMPSFRGALIPQSWFGEFFLISFLLPYLSDDKNGMKWSLLSVLFVMVGLTFCNLLILSLFGHNISTMQYPVLTAFRYISVAGFLDNFESVVMAIWVLGNFVKISLFYYAVSLSLSQWLNLSDMRPVVIGLGILMIMFSFWSLPSLQDVTTYLTGAFVIFGTLMQTIVPALLLAIGYVRRNKVT